MPRTPDRFAGPRKEEELRFEDRGPAGDNAGDPTVEGSVRRVTNVLRYFVNGIVTQIARWKNPPVGFDDVDLNGLADGQGLAYVAANNQFEPTSFLDETAHRGFDQLVHEIAEDSHEVITYTGFLVTNVTVWTDNTLTTRIRETQITYTGFRPTQVTTIQYDAAGLAVETLVEDINYIGLRVSTIDRNLTP